MRAFALLLILINLLFLAWARGYFSAPGSPDASRMQQQIMADKIKVVARDEPPPETTRTDKAGRVLEKKGIELCQQFTDLPIVSVIRLEGLLAEKMPSAKSVRTMITGSATYWVFIPPLPSKQDVDKKASELKALRVPEFFIVQDAGPNRFAISLGIFSSKEAATERLEMLRSKGVKSAKVGERDVKSASVSVEVRVPEALAEALRQVVAEALPQNKPVECKVQTVQAAPVQ